MYSQNEIDEAISAGAITAEAAEALRTHIQRQREMPLQDEEQFRLITGFNDIFVSIATAILLFAVAWIGQSIGAALGFTIEGGGPSPLAPLAVAGAAWVLALFFTAKRRMALPSILLLLAFVAGVFSTTLTALILIAGTTALEEKEALGGLIAAGAGAIAAAAAWLHWKQFRVPITVAAGAGAVVAIAVGLLAAMLGNFNGINGQILLGFVLALGVGMFLFAMWWDATDRSRVTRRSDVAFWLHLLAAPMIAHPVFTLLGLNDGNATILEGLIVTLLYVALGLTALAIDRRALLVSALAYVLWALSDLFERFGAVELSVALTALIIGSALLLLSAFWNQARKAVVSPLPDRLQARLPVLNRAALTPQPAA